MESTLKNMVVTLLAITLVSAGALSVVYSMTKDAIELSKSAKTIDALGRVIPEFDNDPTTDTVTVSAKNLPVKVYTGKKGGQPIGYAVESWTRQGYSGDIRFMVGFLPDGGIYNIEVLEHSETPGLGSKIADKDNPVLLSFKGNSPADLVMKVKKDGGDIDVITASTISSRAYTDAVDRAYIAFKEVAFGEEQKVAQARDFLPEIFPDFDGDVSESEITSGGKNYSVFDNETTVAVESIVEGYNGPIRMLVGFKPDGTIYDIFVYDHMETPEFGGEIIEKDNPLAASFRGRNPLQMKLSFRSEGGDVDGISGSSITSQAYMDAVVNAHKALVSYMETIKADE